ncbi:hypothetical protein RYX36_007422, partial [Vicia faba]
MPTAKLFISLLCFSLLTLSVTARPYVLVLSQEDFKDEPPSDPDSSPEWDEFGDSDSHKSEEDLDPGSWRQIFEPTSTQPQPQPQSDTEALYYSVVTKLMTGDARLIEEGSGEIETAAESGYPAAQSVLGFLWGMGLLRERSKQKAFVYHHFASDGGNMQSKMALAYTYTRQDMFDKSVKLYAELAEVDVNGFLISKDSPVIEPIRLHNGAEENKEALRKSKGEEDEDFQILEYQAQKGNAAAMYKVGLFYYFGLRGLRRDHSKALSWFLKAVEKGEHRSMELLGEIYASGAGVERNYTKAFEWLTLASKHHLYSAYNGIGYLYVKGYGVDNKNYTKAKEYFEKAAENDEVGGHYNLGVMFLKGIGVKRDVRLACKYFIVAANNAIGAISSPRLGIGAMKKSTLASRKSGTGTGTGTGSFPSPGTPNYRHCQGGVAMQKGWSSERVPLSGVRKQVGNGPAALCLSNGRTLPSKWEDAERWILSPVSGDTAGRALVPQSLRRPKSKSGPLGPPGVASLYSPAGHYFDGGGFMSASPFSAAVNASSVGFTNSSGGNGGVLPARTDPCMARSVSVHGCSQMQGQSSVPAREEKFDSFKDAGTNVSPAVSRRDMATQMSPEGSSCSSPNRRTSFSASTPPAMPVTELQSASLSKMDIRDVQVDERVTMTRWSKKHRALFIGRGSESVDSWKKKETSTRSTSWEISESSKTISKAKREEAKITAWENLQKAKAEAAIRKLEMKLEKKRASSMDKIMNKLRSAQKKAQEMRGSVLDNQTHQVARTSHK